MKNLFKYTYKSEIDIDASREVVWQVLSNWADYPKWNPFTPQIDSEWELGKEVFLTVKMKPNQSPMIRTEYLKKLQSPEVVAWGFSWGWFLKALRTQTLIQVDDKKTRYINEDVVQGLISPMAHILFGKWIQRGFNAISLALKKHVESHGIKK